MAMALLAMAMAALLLLPPSTEAAAAAFSHIGASDTELAERKMQCYQDIDNGLWGYACKSSPTDKENCALICVSSSCYESIYGTDPLEEGEVDLRRGREFKACIRGDWKGDMARAKSSTM